MLVTNKNSIARPHFNTTAKLGKKPGAPTLSQSSDSVEISTKDLLVDVGKSAIKNLPKTLARTALGMTCSVLGVVGGALYSATVLGPLVTAAARSAPKTPSLEEAVFRGQMSPLGQMAMGSGDLAESGTSFAGNFVKEMAAPITWGYEAFREGYKILD